MKTVDLIYFNAGGGHRAAAQALEQVIRTQKRPWEIRLVNLTEVLDPKGVFRKFTGIEPEDIYNKRLASGFTLGLAQELKLLQGGIHLAHKNLVKTLRLHWLKSQPDLVVSLIPNFNKSLYQSLAQGVPGVPYVTVLTDMADHPPNFWIEPGQPQHVVCGTEQARHQALSAGCHPGLVHLVSGMILRPDFYRRPALDRAAAREAVGLSATDPTGLVLFGGHGSNGMKQISRRLGDIPLILMCGRNKALADSLRALPSKAPRVVVEFTPDVPHWMEMADFFIGKPGPGSLSEAVHMGLPVIVTRNASTMPQERWNTDWVKENGVGVVERSFRTVHTAVRKIIDDLPQFREAVRRVDNRAVFEVVEIMARLLDDAGLRQSPSRIAEGVA